MKGTLGRPRQSEGGLKDMLVNVRGEPTEEAWDVVARLWGPTSWKASVLIPFLLHPRRIGPILLDR